MLTAPFAIELAELTVCELSERAQFARQQAAHKIVVQRKALQLLQFANLRRHTAFEAIRVKVQHEKIGQSANLRGQCAVERVVTEP